MQTIPNQLRNNSLSKILDAIRLNYGHLSRNGRINGLIIADQDAKVLAVNSLFENQINYWDIGAIGAALYGVSKQGKDFFHAEDLERATMIYQNTQFFVESIGVITIEENRKRELILIILGDKAINIGLVVMQMKKFAPEIKATIEADTTAKTTMQLSEEEFMKQISTLKKELFSMGTNSKSM
jgi:predicted regulator of Ras-like GTPase activity (Roadblock/LC7/MglB family)